jgi:hypothetical protein
MRRRGIFSDTEFLTEEEKTFQGSIKNWNIDFKIATNDFEYTTKASGDRTSTNVRIYMIEGRR